MDDATKFTRIFGEHQRRATYGDRLRIRDGAFIADLKARVSGLAAADNRGRGGGWLIDFSRVRTDELTERSLFEAILTSAAEGERRLSFGVGRDWVQIGSGAMESSVRTNADNLERALANAFRRVVLRSPRDSIADVAEAGRAGA